MHGFGCDGVVVPPLLNLCCEDPCCAYRDILSTLLKTLLLASSLHRGLEVCAGHAPTVWEMY